MRKFTTIAAAAGMVFASSAAFSDDNDVYVSQTSTGPGDNTQLIVQGGIGNNIGTRAQDVFQVGTNNTMEFFQAGNGNSIESTWQRRGSAAGQTMFISQDGDANHAEAQQRGRRNSLDAQQDGYGNTLSAYQGAMDPLGLVIGGVGNCVRCSITSLQVNLGSPIVGQRRTRTTEAMTVGSNSAYLVQDGFNQNISNSQYGGGNSQVIVQQGAPSIAAASN